MNKGKLHLNRQGSSFLANNFKKFVNTLWTSVPLAKICPNTHKHPMDSLDGLKSLRINHHSNITLSYLNINSIRKKFDDLKLIINENVDIICIAETKIDKSFPTARFLLPGFNKPYRLDISDKQGGLLIYIKAHLASRLLSTHISPKDMQAIPFELNLRKEKWIFVCSHRPAKQDSQHFLENLKTFLRSLWCW